jgi:hypothetical protein
MEANKFDYPSANADDGLLETGTWTNDMGTRSWTPGKNGGGAIGEVLTVSTMMWIMAETKLIIPTLTL